MTTKTKWVVIMSALLPSLARPHSARGQDTPRTARVSLVRTDQSTQQRLVLLVRVEGVGTMLGSYQGRLTFDPSVLVVDSVSPGRDGSRFVNSTEAARGTIRFAGFAPTGFASNDAVRIVGRLRKAIDSSSVRAALEVAGDIEGRAVPRTALLSTPLRGPMTP